MPPPAPTVAERSVAAFEVAVRALWWGSTGPRDTPDAWRAAEPEVVRDALATLVLRVVAVDHAHALGLVEEGIDALRRRLGATPRERGAGEHAGWTALSALFRALHATHRGPIFDPTRAPLLDVAPFDDDALRDVLDLLATVATDAAGAGGADGAGGPDVESVGAAHEALIGLTIDVAPEPRLVLRGRRRPGALPADPAVGLDTLLAAPPERRIDVLASLGVDLAPGAATAVARAADLPALAAALGRRRAGPARVPPGCPVPQPTEARRRAGAHYTPRALTEPVVERTLRPLLDALGDTPAPAAILGLRVCDPAMGCGAFLVAACRALGRELAVALRHAGDRRADQVLARDARVLVAQHALHGVDRDPRAVEVARLSLWLACGDPGQPMTFVDARLRVGDALVARAGVAGVDAPFAWEEELPEVFCEGRGGFDAFIGNPPWVSYAGRSAQPLDPARRAYLEATYASFAGFRNLQGVFVERCAQLLRPGGRLGLVLPSSMSEQGGYAPTRAAHDRLAACDPELLDVGEDAFPGVFQPCLVLTSTRRGAPVEAVDAPWPVERPDLDDGARRLVARMTAGPCLPASLFGERGLQSSGDDLAHLAPTADARHDVPLRAGGDIHAFSRRAPSHHADAAWFGRRLRTPAAWAEVRLLIRQTAPYPIATLSDGVAFRNSILAGFASDEHPPALLVAWLNASPIRWLHFVRHRDARQGMPQLKIGHLRTIPAPPPGAPVAELARLGEALAARDAGVAPDEQRALDHLVERSFGLDPDDVARIAAWAHRHAAAPR